MRSLTDLYRTCYDPLTRAAQLADVLLFRIRNQCLTNEPTKL